MEPIFLFGASGHGKVVIDSINRRRAYTACGMLDDDPRAAGPLCGVPVLGTIDNLAALCAVHGTRKGIVTIGDNWTRFLVAERIRSLVPDFEFVNAVHPDAHIAQGATIGPGSVVMPKAVIGPDTRVGAHCIVNTGAQLDHDGLLEDFASLAPGAVAGGNCRLNGFAAVGIGAVLRHGTTVGEHAVVGAGAVILADVPGNEVWFGVPARRIRSRRPGDAYL